MQAVARISGRDRYDRELADIFAVQDEVTQGIVGRLIAHVDKAEIRRAQQKPPQMLEAYDLYLRGRGAGLRARRCA